MPIIKDVFYQLCGWQRVTIVTEQEMAEMLGIERGELRSAIMAGYLAIHAGPQATDDETYWFRPATAQENVERWRCLSQNNFEHDWQFDGWYDRRQKKAKHKCSRCPATKYD